MGNLYIGSTLVTASLGTVAEWIRPSDWLPVPVTGSQEFAGLIAVYPTEGNFVALSAAGAYQVDWGDGTIINTGSGVIVYHSHSYDSLPSESYCTRGYRQAWVRVTPSGSGVNLTNVNLQKLHNQSGIPSSGRYTWLDVILNGPNVTSFPVGGTNMFQSTLERVKIDSIGTLTDCVGMFYNCVSLQSVSLFDTSNILNFSNMFRNCYELKTIPSYNISSGTNFSSMFASCYSLETIPPLNTSSGSDFTSMFQNCEGLKYIPIIDTSKGTNFTSMFNGNDNLISIPPLNTSSGSLFTTMFSSCTALRIATLSGSTRTISYANCNLSKDEIISIFNNLGTASGSNQSITCSGNWGTSSLVPSDSASVISKGWAGVLW